LKKLFKVISVFLLDIMSVEMGKDDEKFGALLMYMLALTSFAFAAMFRLSGNFTWIAKIWLICFCISSFGFELWFTFALAGGDSLDQRRANEEIDELMPSNIYWAVNASTDGGLCMLAVLVLACVQKIPTMDDVFERLRLVAIIPLYIIFITQAIVLPQRWAPGSLSWAPLSPLGEAVNPYLLTMYGNHSITVCRLCPWLFMAPISYGVTLWILYRKRRRHSLRTLGTSLICNEKEDEQSDDDNISIASIATV